KRINSLPEESVFTLQADASTSHFLLHEATKDGGSVAELKRVISKYLLDPLGRELSKGTINGGNRIVVTHNSGAAALTFCKMESEAIAIQPKLSLSQAA
ncbi:hypothetical protein KA344_12345, partial [bacterium]|nr:hypothetical protein [bacterium]